MNKDVLVNLNMSFPEGDVQKMLCHLNQLDEIRNNQHFRMVFLFQEESCSSFINDFNKRQPKMLQFLNEMEECAVQLVKMKKGALISSVAGSSVGAVGSGLSIAGLALIPFTAGLSLGLTIGGTVMGITSGVNSAVTTFTEMGVNSKYRNKADDIIKNLMNEMQNLQKCLEQVISQPVTQIEVSYFLSKATFKGVTNVLSVAWSFRSLSKDVSDIKLIKNGNVIIREGKVVAKEGKALRNIAEVATEVATDGKDVGQATVKGTLATSKSARAGFIAVNALCLGMDIFFICKDSISLAKGSETEVSQFIRARAALWSSEIDSWRKIRDSLNEGLQTSEKRKAVLETPFYLDG
ncbi:uncharacterized protein [Leuresthes tenuis]|uniref:uncharacterized protein n=1 Tax=Leuresthes tenuis TaxID=355514 RepID=UPI003B50F9CA